MEGKENEKRRLRWMYCPFGLAFNFYSRENITPQDYRYNMNVIRFFDMEEIDL